MTVRINYIKNFVSGKNKGTKFAAFQDVDSSIQAAVLQRVLAEVSDLFPATDPETGDICFVSDISEEMQPDMKESA